MLFLLLNLTLSKTSLMNPNKYINFYIQAIFLLATLLSLVIAMNESHDKEIIVLLVGFFLGAYQLLASLFHVLLFGKGSQLKWHLIISCFYLLGFRLHINSKVLLFPEKMGVALLWMIPIGLAIYSWVLTFTQFNPYLKKE